MTFEVEVLHFQAYLQAEMAPGRFLLAAQKGRVEGRSMPHLFQNLITLTLDQVSQDVVSDEILDVQFARPSRHHQSSCILFILSHNDRRHRRRSLQPDSLGSLHTASISTVNRLSDVSMYNLLRPPLAQVLEPRAVTDMPIHHIRHIHLASASSPLVLDWLPAKCKHTWHT